MDHSQWNRDLDERLAATGVVDRELFGQFVDADGYGAATSIHWLEAKLGVLAERVQGGGALTLHDPDSRAMISVRTREDLLTWIGLHFPGRVPDEPASAEEHRA